MTTRMLLWRVTMFAERTNWNLAPNRLSEALAAASCGGKAALRFERVESDGSRIFLRSRDDAARAVQSGGADVRARSERHVRARQGVAEYYAERGEEVSAEDVILTASTSEAYSFVFRALCNPGDELLVPAPSYPLFGFLADIQTCGWRTIR